MHKIVKCNKEDYATLSSIWERSVRATHDFLDENTIEEIKTALVPHYFPNVELYALSHNGTLTGFIGLCNDMIEMLFIDSHSRGHGHGTSLIEFALDRGITKVDVNEQNHRALAFYQAKGFKIIGRDSTDEAGRPYPILHLSILYF